MKKRFAIGLITSALSLGTLGTTVVFGNSNHRSNGYLTKSDLRIGKLTIGETLTNVKRIYGNPTTKATAHGEPDPRWIYTKQGFAVNGQFHVTGNPVWQIEATKSDVGSTRRGIHVGSSEQALRRDYPHLKVLVRSKFFEEIDNPYAVDFQVSKGVVKRITITDLHP